MIIEASGQHFISKSHEPFSTASMAVPPDARVSQALAVALPKFQVEIANSFVASLDSGTTEPPS